MGFGAKRTLCIGGSTEGEGKRKGLQHVTYIYGDSIKKLTTYSYLKGRRNEGVKRMQNTLYA
jgi:hypothetical protein